MLRFLVVLVAAACAVSGKSVELPNGKLHLRSGDAREWRSFPEKADGPSAAVAFDSKANAIEYTLTLRQRDVKKNSWTVSVNGRKLGVLQDDEREMLRVLAIPAGTLRSGRNTLEIMGDSSGFSDDIELRDIRIEAMPVPEWLGQATVTVDSAGEQGSMPVKISVVDREGSLVPFLSLLKDSHEAHRTGVLYTATGRAKLTLPAGEYRIYASRGFEYSAPVQRVHLKQGTEQSVRLRLRKEVNLSGYVSCDPHVHTFELSRHGDASVDERVLTAAGEGLDLIVSTEHNRVDDYSDVLERRRLSKWTRVLPGNEVTTAMGHFNIFPARPGKPQPDPRATEWPVLMDSLYKADTARIVIQNHPRDLHSKYRPFDPAHHLFPTGTNAAGRPFRANAMEVVNSGAMHSDIMQLVRDWMGLLTRGLRVAAVGSSDTHTVDFVPIGQARTYIEGTAGQAVEALAQGRNLVSYGLAAELRTTGDAVELTVHGPSWSSVDSVQVFSNGIPVWQDTFAAVRKRGVKYRRTLRLDLPRHDTALVAVASGPGVLEPFWEVRKPYQPTSGEWTPRVLGVSQAVWLDRDGDGRLTSPLQYAEALRNIADLSALVERLKEYDASVTMHTVELLRASGRLDHRVRAAFQAASRRVRDAYESYMGQVQRLTP